MRSPENVVFAAIRLTLTAEERELVQARWGLCGKTAAPDVDTAAERLGVPRLLARRRYAVAVAKLRSDPTTRRALAAFEARRAA